MTTLTVHPHQQSTHSYYSQRINNKPEQAIYRRAREGAVSGGSCSSVAEHWTPSCDYVHNSPSSQHGDALCFPKRSMHFRPETTARILKQCFSYLCTFNVTLSSLLNTSSIAMIISIMTHKRISPTVSAQLRSAKERLSALRKDNTMF